MAKQLVSLELDQKDSIVSRFEESFKQMWVSNGNALSKIYAGTAALSQGGSIPVTSVTMEPVQQYPFLLLQ